MQSSLLNLLAPYTDESLASLISRLTLANHYPKTNWITFLLPTKLTKYKNDNLNLNLLCDPAVLERLAELTQLTVDELIGLTLNRFAPMLQKNEQGAWLGRGVAIKFSHSRNSAQVCPRCLAEGSYHRLAWDLKSVVMCSTHRLLLVDRCPECAGRLSTHRLEPARCGKCKADLRKAQAVSLEGDPEGQAAQARVWADLGLPVANVPVWPVSSPLDGLAMPHLFALRRALHFFLLELPFDSPCLQPCRFDLGEVWAGIAGPHKRRKLSSTVRYTLSSAVHRVLSGWPESFYLLLEASLQANRPGKQNGWIQRHFGFWYKRWLHTELADPALDFVHAAFYYYLAAEYHGGFTGQMAHIRRGSALATTTPRHFYASTQVRSLLDLSKKDLVKWVADGVLDTVMKPAGRSRQRIYLVARPDVDRRRRAYQGRITFHRTVLQLGLSRAAVEQLVSAGYLHPEGDLVERGAIYWLFQPQAVAELIGHYTALADTSSLQADGKVIPLTWAVYIMRPAVSDNVAGILNLVDRGLLKPRLRSSRPGLGRLVFLHNDLKACRRSIRGLTFSEAAHSLGVQTRDARHWVKTGLLPMTGMDLITLDDLTKLRQQYVMRREAAQILGIGLATLNKRAKLGKCIVDP